MMKIFLLFLLLAPFQVHASLGDTLSANQSGTQLKASANNSVMMQNYSIRESTYSGGTQKEYINAEGKIFAITWTGIKHVDVETTLGAYQTSLKTAQKNHEAVNGHRFERRPVSLKSGDLVYETSGHMGKVQGRAYVPSLVPDSVSIKDIK